MLNCTSTVYFHQEQCYVMGMPVKKAQAFFTPKYVSSRAFQDKPEENSKKKQLLNISKKLCTEQCCRYIVRCTVQTLNNVQILKNFFLYMCTHICTYTCFLIHTKVMRLSTCRVKNLNTTGHPQEFSNWRLLGSPHRAFCVFFLSPANGFSSAVKMCFKSQVVTAMRLRS